MIQPLHRSVRQEVFGLTDPDSLRSSREKAASIDAGALVGKLRAALLEQYIDPKTTQA
ncbi:MAG: hypothetical protein E6X12_10165 [Actinomyces sp.]|uniref:hypothetical protein n=1 Tax=Actinomycetaceae TaxID=2049 RepID=UPI000A6A0285|nr:MULTISPECIES: hypothetical protein [Actinomycetaceae]MBS5900370.1 hypothetical protein [Actinomycetaceae bacterium]MDU1353084.1 hypothetical protein [Actinomyces sp.]MDK6243604.1 hypothetical protein [Pauljensenia sp. UMB10120]MDU1521497.1 hypothetical protein [Actinomyces sp.]MDU2984396.1 hypothetical protein [Actinomyces sp.]